MAFTFYGKESIQNLIGIYGNTTQLMQLVKMTNRRFKDKKTDAQLTNRDLKTVVIAFFGVACILPSKLWPASLR